MTQDEIRRLENQLIVMGLNGLTDPELIPQMARLIKDDEFFLGLINQCDEPKRREMYDALKPHLKFEPQPLDWYINKLKDRANAIASREKPIQVGKNKYREVPQQLATGVVVDLKCSCGRIHSYYGESPLSAVILARQDGWVRDKFTNKEVCPKCPSEYRGKRKKCPTCTRSHYAPDCRMISHTQERERGIVVVN